MSEVLSTFPLNRVRNREQVSAYSLEDHLYVIIDPRQRVIAEDKAEMRARVLVGAFNRLGNVETIGDKGECPLPILIEIPENHHNGYAGEVDIIHNHRPHPMRVEARILPGQEHSLDYRKSPLDGTTTSVTLVVSKPGRYLVTIPHNEEEKQAVIKLSGQGELTDRELFDYRGIMRTVLNFNRRQFNRQQFEELWGEAGTFHRRSSEMRMLVVDSDPGIIVSTEVPSIESAQRRYGKEYRAATERVEAVEQFSQLQPFDHTDEDGTYLALIAQLGVDLKATTKWGAVANEVRRLIENGANTHTVQEGGAVIVGPDDSGEYKFYSVRRIKEVVPCRSGKSGYLCDVGVELATREINGRLTLEEMDPSEKYVNARSFRVKPEEAEGSLLPMKCISRVSLDSLLSELREFNEQQRARHQYGGRDFFTHSLLYEACVQSLGLNLSNFGRS